MNRLIKTVMMKRYMVKLAVRVGIFLGVLIPYLLHKEWLNSITMEPVWKQITPLHVLWLIFMLMMLNHIFPANRLSMALHKREAAEYDEAEGYSRMELYRFVQDQNVKAWNVMLVWLMFNGIFGVLYLVQVIDETDLVMLSVFYFLCDYVCILFYCPFQSLIMKNRCCVNCRIYDWGHFMMFTPMLFIRNFFSWSLFFTSCVVLIHWEIIYAKHPERFWSGSNRKLQCAGCRDKICQIKGKLAEQVASRSASPKS